MPPVSTLQFKEIMFVSPDDKDDICKMKCYISNDTLNKIKIDFEYIFRIFKGFFQKIFLRESF